MVSPRNNPSDAGNRSLTNSGQPSEDQTVLTRRASCAKLSKAFVKASSLSQIALNASCLLSQVIFDIASSLDSQTKKREV